MGRPRPVGDSVGTQEQVHVGLKTRPLLRDGLTPWAPGAQMSLEETPLCPRLTVW